MIGLDRSGLDHEDGRVARSGVRNATGDKSLGDVLALLLAAGRARRQHQVAARDHD